MADDETRLDDEAAWPFLYILTGRVQPERIALEIQYGFGLVAKLSDDLAVSFKLSVFNSLATVIARTQEPIRDHETFAASLWDVVATATDAAAFIHGIQFTIDQVCLLDLNENTFFGVQNRITAIPEMSDTKFTIDDLVSASLESKPLKHALASFRKGIGSPLTSPSQLTARLKRLRPLLHTRVVLAQRRGNACAMPYMWIGIGFSH